MTSYLFETLPKEEIVRVARSWAIEDVWRTTWREHVRSGSHELHWSIRGEDAHRLEIKELYGRRYESFERYIDMRNYYFINPMTNKKERIGWVRAERILRSKPGVVPSDINWFVRRYFGKDLFGYQLYFYYALQPAVMVVGGRGSAKTTGLALVIAAWISLHPGQPWAHFAYTSQQAIMVHQIITSLGSMIHDTNLKPDMTWTDRYLDRAPKSPHYSIVIKPWANGDPGCSCIIGPLGQTQGATRTRSINVRRTSIDECTRDIADENILAVAEATARGINEVRLAWLPKDKQEEVKRAQIVYKELSDKEIAVGLTDEERELKYQIEETNARLGITCALNSIRTGNRGPHHWIDEVLYEAERNPVNQWAAIVSYLENPFLDVNARRKLEASFRDPAVRRVELFAEKPIGHGTWFAQSDVLACEKLDLWEEFEKKIAQGENGYHFNMFGPHVIHYEKPPRKDRIYVLGGDPGTGVVPRRDAWVVLVFAIDLDSNDPNAELVYFRWGNTTDKLRGNWDPFMNALRYAIGKYKIAAHNAILQLSGPESGIVRLMYGRHRQMVSHIKMTEHKKMEMANYTRDLVANHILRWPSRIGDITIQMSNWDPKNDKNYPQDITMAIFGASMSLIDHFHHLLFTENFHEENPHPSSPVVASRASRVRKATYARRARF